MIVCLFVFACLFWFGLVWFGSVCLFDDGDDCVGDDDDDDDDDSRFKEHAKTPHHCGCIINVRVYLQPGFPEFRREPM